MYNEIKDKWLRPWNIKKFDDLTVRDERFFSIVIKGCLAYMNKTILMYDKPINHFIFNTGSSYLYIESDGYEYKISETTGEDQMYNTLPRCVCNLADINIPIDNLTNPFIRGVYERKSSIDNEYKGYNAQMRRLPLEITMNLTYVLSNFNESIILAQEIIDKLVFQQYYNVNYLGQIIQCSIEFPVQTNVNINKIDFDSTEVNQKTMEIQIKINTNYPIINQLTEIENSKVIVTPAGDLNVVENNKITDTHKYTID